MSRRKTFKKKIILPDIKFKSLLISKFINLIMIDGKKTIAEFIVYSALNMLSEIFKKSHLDIFEESLNNVKPSVEIKSRRVGGSTYQIPIEINEERKNTLAMKWIISSARKRKEKSMQIKLLNELSEALNNKGSAIKKRDEIHRIANANKAFAHYRW